MLIAGGASTLALGCRQKERLLSVDDAWTAIVVALGPWSPQDRELAREFAAIYRTANRPVPAGVVLPKLAGKLATATSTGVQLSALSVRERAMVEMIVGDIYNSPQVFGYIRGEPPLGQCIGDRTRYTRSPAELGW